MKFVTKLGIGIAVIAFYALILFGFPKFAGLVMAVIAGWQVGNWSNKISSYVVDRLYPEQ